MFHSLSLTFMEHFRHRHVFHLFEKIKEEKNKKGNVQRDIYGRLGAHTRIRDRPVFRIEVECESLYSRMRENHLRRKKKTHTQQTNSETVRGIYFYSFPSFEHRMPVSCHVLEMCVAGCVKRSALLRRIYPLDRPVF